MRMLKWFGFLAALLVVAFAGIAGAQERESGDGDGNREADRNAIRKSGSDFVDAFDRGDAKTAASAWTDQGEYHDDGGAVIRGRDAIEKSYAEFFEEQTGSRINLDVKSIRFPSRDTAIEEGVLVVTPAGAHLPKSTRYSALHVREDGNWKIAFAREWGTVRDDLQDLEWLVGQWVARAEDREVQMSFTWNSNKTGLRNEFTMNVGGKPASSGIQLIGVEPQTGLLSSWMFPDDGGMAHAVWSSDGDRWLAESTGSMPDGSETTATNVIARTNDDEFTWRSIDRTINGEPVPDTPPIKVTRVKVEK